MGKKAEPVAFLFFQALLPDQERLGGKVGAQLTFTCLIAIFKAGFSKLFIIKMRNVAL